MGRDFWSEVLERVRHRVSPPSFNTWLKPTRMVSKNAGKLTLGVPNPLFAEWLKGNYQGLIAEAVREVDGKAWEIEFKSPEIASSPSSPGSAVPVLRPQFDARYTFENFVVGGANRFAHAAAVAVAESHARAYNPLYIYGGTGLGKTHLMHAIGNAVSRSGSMPRVKYVTTETFVNEMINAIRFERTQEFKDRYRNVDLLLIDDIQFLAGKERTQEEFFHTFNALYESGRQIVMTSDCAPKDIPKIEERLRSRFEWGLMADIQPPDLETRIAILSKKSAAVGIELPSDVALFVASKIKSNVRELEGALNRVCAYRLMHAVPISLDLVKEALKDVLHVEPPVITVESIQKVVADYHNLKVSELKSKTNAQEISFPRQIAMYLCKLLTNKSLPEIGRRFGGKHHSTVIHAIRKIESKRAREQDFDRLMSTLTQMFQ